MCDKAFNIAKTLTYDGYERGFDSMFYTFFDKNSAVIARSETLAARDKSASDSDIKNENFSNEELQQKNYTNQLLETLTKDKYTQFL